MEDAQALCHARVERPAACCTYCTASRTSRNAHFVNDSDYPVLRRRNTACPAALPLAPWRAAGYLRLPV